MTIRTDRVVLLSNGEVSKPSANRFPVSELPKPHTSRRMRQIRAVWPMSGCDRLLAGNPQGRKTYLEILAGGRSFNRTRMADRTI